jgi:hypothetical protein
MKKALPLIWIFLFAFTSMAFINPRTQKLIFGDKNWGYDPMTGQLQIPLRSSFGIAIAGEKAGFIASVYVEIYNTDGSLAGIGEGSGQIKIIEDAWDSDHYIGIEPVLVDLLSAVWNGDDDGLSIVTGWVNLESSNGIVLMHTPVTALQIYDLFPKLPGIWGRLANPGFHNKKIKSTLFFAGQARDGSQYYECYPGPNIGLYTVHPIDQEHLNWSVSTSNQSFALGKMVEAGLNTVSMSSWGEDFLPCGTGWSLIAPMQTAPGSHDELFEAAGDHHMVIIPFIESRNDWTLRGEFPNRSGHISSTGAFNQIVNLIDRYLLNEEHPEWASRWAQVWDQSLQPRYAITLIHASSNLLNKTAHTLYAQGFDDLADEVFIQTGVRVGFFIDPLPPDSNAPGVFKPIPESTGPALLLTDSILGIQAFIPEIWLPGNPSDSDLITFKNDYSQRWSQTGLPFLMDVSPGYDASIVFPNSITYGFTQNWQVELSKMVIDYGQDGLTFNSWNGYTEGMAAVPTVEYSDRFFNWLQSLCTIIN